MLFAAVCFTALLFIGTSPATAQLSFEQPPIDYNNAPRTDPITKLQKLIDSGKVKLEYDSKHGYLPAVLKHLNVPQSSQVLVFTKTSFQLRRISPRTPRAVYFGDSAYVGWVQGGNVVEITAVDPQLGGIYYSLDQKKTERPKFTRHTHTCTQCHASTLTGGVPGHTVRSVYPAPDGHPILRAGTFRTDQSSPFHQRWGGWYVSGTHGKLRHMGNMVVRDSDDTENLNLDRGANITDLNKIVDVRPYLVPHSDIVALMVLEHQTQMHNLITRANYLSRITFRDQKVLNEMLNQPDDYQSASTKRRIQSACEPLVEYMLMASAIKFDDKICGTSKFTEEFTKEARRTQSGRSLRDLDLKKSLFKYPCSYLIYSSAFNSLPAPPKEYIYRRMWEVLSGADKSKKYVALSAEDRRAVLEILRETKKDLPKYWHAKK